MRYYYLTLPDAGSVCVGPRVRRAPMRYICVVCGYIYDPALGEDGLGVAPGTAWEDLPEGYECPICGFGKEQFDAE